MKPGAAPWRNMTLTSSNSFRFEFLVNRHCLVGCLIPLVYPRGCCKTSERGSLPGEYAQQDLCRHQQLLSPCCHRPASEVKGVAREYGYRYPSWGCFSQHPCPTCSKFLVIGCWWRPLNWKPLAFITSPEHGQESKLRKTEKPLKEPTM